MTEMTGYLRPDGKVGVRNHVLVLATVSCVNGVIQRISREVPEAVCVPHAFGCGRGGPRDLQILFRILSGMVHHPNVGAVVLIGLGCEVSNTKNLSPLIKDCGKPVEILNVQECGSLKTAQKGAEAARRLLNDVKTQPRISISWDKLLVAMECGGSDAMSGVTANPAMGAVSDWIVEKGGTVIFGENTEMIGTDHVLARRAKDEQVAEHIVRMVNRADKLAHDIMGNMAGLVKGGSTTINQVVDYGEPPTEKGLILQDGPGYDGDSMAGLAASGAQVMFFSTGRGTPAGFPILPVIKVASNSRIYETMEDDMDVNAGTLGEGKSREEIREEMIDLLTRVVNGQKTKAEVNGMDVFTLMTVHPPF
ncbi:MAG: UxaA family hydrolase [Deltaproteobacteria bacterium]|nr:UxaA family hydrolase [Deltaproteobacteria bacterium]